MWCNGILLSIILHNLFAGDISSTFYINSFLLTLIYFNLMRHSTRERRGELGSEICVILRIGKSDISLEIYNFFREDADSFVSSLLRNF